ncbi:MAG: hypothetical protein IJ489_04920 [Clostridia bacterium]|nr:hypothetical protein [Clostridia bacterium]
MLLRSSEFCKALKKIGWSYVFIHIHFKLGTFDLLCDWIGYLLILSAVGILTEEEPTAKLLRPFAIALAAVSGIESAVSLFGASIDIFNIVTILTTVISIYLQFQLLTNIADMAKRRNYPNTGRIIKLRTVVCVLHVAAMSILYIDILQTDWLMIAVPIVYLVLIAWIWSVLISLRVFAQENEEDTKNSVS